MMRTTTRKTNQLWTVCLSCLLLLNLFSATFSAEASAAWRRPRFLGGKSSGGYTPLLFFTIPPGNLPEVDAMEKAVRKVEKELGVRVERMDVARNPANEAVLAAVTPKSSLSKSVPLLYNRESMEFYSLPSSSSKRGGDDDDDATVGATPPPMVNLDKVRAWAKGRVMSTSSRVAAAAAQTSGTKVSAPIVVMSEDNAIDQDEMMETEMELDMDMEDFTLTPHQRQGKKAMQERTEKLAEAGEK